MVFWIVMTYLISVFSVGTRGYFANIEDGNRLFLVFMLTPFVNTLAALYIGYRMLKEYLTVVKSTNKTSVRDLIELAFPDKPPTKDCYKGGYDDI